MENKWQKYYRETLCGGTFSAGGTAELEYTLLGKVGEKLTVHFPDGEKTFKVTFDDCNIPNGIISVRILASNLRLWIRREHKIDF